MKSSIFFPTMVKTGSYIMKLESIDLEKTMDEKAEEEQKKIDETIENSTLEIVKDAKDKIKKKATESLKNEGKK